MTTEQSGWQPAYAYHPDSGQYLGEVRAWLSPLDQTYPLPANAISAAPAGELQQYQAFCINASKTDWEIVPDYLGATVYDTATAQPVNPPAFGQPLATNQTLAKLPELEPQQAAQWNTQTKRWQTVADWRGVALYSTVDGSLVQITTLGQTPAEIDATPIPRPDALYHWQDGAWQPDATLQAQAAWAAYQDQASTALKDSDVTVLRCFENGVALPAEWKVYRTALRAILSTPSGDTKVPLPAMPDYPAGS